MFAFDPALAGLWGTTITAASGVIVAILLRQNKRIDSAAEAAKLASWGTAVQSEKILAAVNENVGTPNGRGNVVEMLERLDERTAATHLLVTEHLKHHERESVDPPVRGPGRVRPLSP